MHSGRVPDERGLNEDEAALLRLVIRGCGHEAAALLEAQIGAAKVVGGIPTLLHLAVPEDHRAKADIPDGPLPGRYYVDKDSVHQGEILVWVLGGLLDALEFAWWSDEAPQRMPAPSSVTIAP